MGKGGDQSTSTVLRNSAAPAVWKSPYNPLAKDAPELPTKGQIKAVIPKECFQRSYSLSFYYMFRDMVMSGALAYAAYTCLTTQLPTLQDSPATWATFVVGWSMYAFWQGTVWTGLWVIAHECGHGAFSDSQTVNDIVGYTLHQALLVPYYGWQYSHAKHHRRTNHLVDGESHVPPTREENGLNDKLERKSYYAAWHEVMGDEAFAVFEIWSHLTLGFPLYIIGLASTGRLANDGTPLNGAIMDHLRPNSPLFPAKLSTKITMSTMGILAMLGFLTFMMLEHGFVPVVCWYWGPYLWTNAWLVLYTWLQHTDPSIPHYGEGEWTWVKGALSTIDRPYGIFDFFHHRIGSTHVVHHLFHEMPWYNALKATHAVKAYLEPKGLYNCDPTPWPVAMWRIARTCHYVDETTGIQYFRSLDDVPHTNSRKKQE
jgi:omega-6 fatty acid desaturase (delta-12 desaturase)